METFRADEFAAAGIKGPFVQDNQSKSTRGVLRGLGYTGRVTSPTFAIANEYHTDRADVAHFDLYRILDSEALFEIGFDEYLDGSKIVLIEWSENAADILPDSYKTVHIQYGTSENDRVVTIDEVKKQ